VIVDSHLFRLHKCLHRYPSWLAARVERLLTRRFLR
jgi:hypothetical protein